MPRISRVFRVLRTPSPFGLAVADQTGMTPSWVTLTPRERDVVRGIVAGRTNREIARELGLSEQAVKNVLTTIYEKIQVRTRLELGLCAMRYDADLHR